MYNYTLNFITVNGGDELYSTKYADGLEHALSIVKDNMIDDLYDMIRCEYKKVQIVNNRSNKIILRMEISL